MGGSSMWGVTRGFLRQKTCQITANAPLCAAMLACRRRDSVVRSMSQQASMNSHQFDAIDAHRRRLIYRSKQRGWLELDILLGDWSSANLKDMNEPQLQEFENILDLENPDLFKWLTGQQGLPEELDG